MIKFKTNQFRKGLKLEIDGVPYNIVENLLVKPGKTQPFNKVKLKSLYNGNVIERTYKSGDSADGADVEEREMQYLYNDGQAWHFMDTANHDQIELSKEQIGDDWRWLQEGTACNVLLYKGTALSIELPNFAVLTITESEPGVKGNTATGASKPATLETGAVINVPLFVEQGEKIRIDTRTGEYVERVKE